MGGGIFVEQELVGVGGKLIVAAAEFISHFGIEFSHGQQCVGYFRGVRRDQVHAAITRNHLLVFGKRALLDGLAVQLCAHLFSASKLRRSGLAAIGIVAGVGIFAGRGRQSAEYGEDEREENWRNAGEQLVEKILACQHPRLARPAALRRSLSPYALT